MVRRSPSGTCGNGDIGAARLGLEPVAHRPALATARQANLRLVRAHRTSPTFLPRGQNASAGSAINVAAPALRRARCAPVSGSIRSLKNLARINFASSAGLLSPFA